MTDLVGKIFQNKYRVVRLLGEGGMGAVYVAEHTILNRQVAVKVMHPNMLTNKEAVDRFFREAQAASAIGHPNIIEIYDVGTEEDGTVFMVMELLKGENLRAMLDRRGSVSHQRAISIVLQILSALHAAHQKGIVHRDLKADNVFLAVDARMREEVKLLDFGIVKVLNDDVKNLSLTKSGTVMGTPQYLSPEQAMGGKDIDHRIDIWTVGLLMYEMLSGRLPFLGENYNEVLSKVLLEPPPPLAELAPNTPAPLVTIVEKALAKDRDERFSTVGEMIGDLLPLRDRATDSLSPSASKALQKSIIPPPAKATVKNGAEHDHRPVVINTPNESVQTLSPDLVETMGAELQAPRYRRNLTAITLAGILAVAAMTAWLMTTKDGAKHEAVEAAVMTAGPRRASQVKPASPIAKTTPPAAIKGSSSSSGSTREPSIAEKSQIEDMAVDSKAKPAEPAQVTIKFYGIPAGGWVTVDKKKVSTPLTMLSSDKPIILKVLANGYQTFEQAIVPNRDHTITVDMKKNGPGAQPAAPKKKSNIKNPYVK